MHVGTGAFFQNLGQPHSDAEVYAHELALADNVEPLGFDSIWTAEHHFTDYHMCPNVAQFLTWMAARTTRVQLGSMVMVLPWHDPVRLAEEVTVLDHMSQGRVLLGLGRGLGRVEFDGFRLEMGESRGRFNEYAEAIVNGLETGKMRADGPLYHQPPIDLRPAPFRSFRNRTWASAISPETSEILARLGVGIMVLPQKPWEMIEGDIAAFRHTWREANNTEAPKPLLLQWVSVGETEAEADEMYERWINGYTASTLVHYEFDNEGLAQIPGYEYYGKLAARIAKHGPVQFTRFLADLQVWGTAEQVAEQLIANVARIDAGGLIVALGYGGMPFDVARANQRRFAEGVLPILKGIDVGPPLGVAGGTVKRDTDLELVRRFFHSREGRTDDLADAVWRTPAAEYTSADHLAREEQLLFRARPVVACLTADLPFAGDYVTFVCAGLPIVVVRGDDGVARGFVNSCRHRGARVAPDDRGHARRCIVCPYHSWTYSFDGDLTAQPGSVGGFSDLDAGTLGLRPLATAEGHGLVLVRPGGTEPIDLAGLLGGVEADLDAAGLAGYHHVETRRQVRALNWKMVIDTFLEAYHIFSLHRQSIAPDYFSTPALFDAFGPNSRYIGVRRSITALEGRPEAEWSILPHASIHYVLVPNTLVVHQIDHFELWRVFPVGVDHAEIHTGIYAPAAPVEEKAQRYWRKNLDAVLAVTGNEDFPQCEQMQADMAAGATAELIFGRNEPALAHYHRSLRELQGDFASR